ncbi:hypothetical protein RB213_011607 [Colletotrichum asianum]
MFMGFVCEALGVSIRTGALSCARRAGSNSHRRVIIPYAAEQVLRETYLVTAARLGVALALERGAGGTILVRLVAGSGGRALACDEKRGLVDRGELVLGARGGDGDGQGGEEGDEDG